MARSSQAERAQAQQALAPLKEQLEQWRAVRREGEAIPAQFWDAAVNAMAQHGTYRVSRELRLDYATLKR